MSKVSYDDWESVIIKKAFLPKEDLTDSEKDILRISFDIFCSRIDDLSYFEEETKRLSKENARLKDFNEELINETKNKKNEKQDD